MRNSQSQDGRNSQSQDGRTIQLIPNAVLPWVEIILNRLMCE